MAKRAHHFPDCTQAEAEKITGKIEGLTASEQVEAERFLARVGPRGLCEILHAMRRWYSFQTGSMARRLLAHREALSTVMALGLPLGVYRGFKVPRDHATARRAAGSFFTLPVTRNGACSSWTVKERFADRFSGADRDKAGVVVTLWNGPEEGTFLAPPAHTDAWFNALYLATMGKAFRFNEEEFAIHGARFLVQVVRIKT